MSSSIRDAILTSARAQIGYALLYTLPRTHDNLGPLLFGFYLTAFSFGASPLLVAWIGANTAGSTKKAGLVSIYVRRKLKTSVTVY